MTLVGILVALGYVVSVIWSYWVYRRYMILVGAIPDGWDTLGVFVPILNVITAAQCLETMRTSDRKIWHRFWRMPK